MITRTTRLFVFAAALSAAGNAMAADPIDPISSPTDTIEDVRLEVVQGILDNLRGLVGFGRDTLSWLGSNNHSQLEPRNVRSSK